MSAQSRDGFVWQIGVGPHRAGSGDEQFDGGTVVGDIECRQSEDLLGGQHQRGSTGDQDLQRRVGSEQIGHQARAPLDHLLAVVQDQQRAPPAQRVDQSVLQITCRRDARSRVGTEVRLTDAERRSDGRHHVVVVADRCERNVVDR
ncbi:Uncharacterised protein [Mycobacteroides abscessus subsp. abscessus]|nr:Uncharacterised protein [Mycobacteroides abscessus subsp. abscessus]